MHAIQLKLETFKVSLFLVVLINAYAFSCYNNSFNNNNTKQVYRISIMIFYNLLNNYIIN